MLPIDAGQLLRVAILSGVIGFAGFCLSYGLYVWRRRNASARRSHRRAVKIGQLLALAAAVVLAIGWGLNEFQGRTGIATGSDLFVLHARQDLSAEQITSTQTVQQGEVLAEFLSPADRTRLAGIDLQRSQALAKRDAIENKVLQSDEALLQEQTHSRSELLQLKGFAFQLRNSRHEIERDRASLLTAWTREESKLIEDVGAAQRELTTALGQRDINRRALERAQDLQRHGNIPYRELDMRSSDVLAADLNVAKQKQAVSSLQERREALSARLESSLASYEKQISELSSDYTRIQTALEVVESAIAATERTLREDRARAIVSRQREVDAVEYDIRILAEEKTRLTEVGRVRAPFTGRVVYRHPAPGLAAGSTPILAISAGTGFTASIRLPRGEVPELAAHAEAVQLALESPVLHQFFTGRFVRSEAIPFEPERVLAYFDCSLPAEIIGLLGNASEPLRVRLLWRPALIGQPVFRLGLLLAAASLICLGFAAWQSAMVHRHARSARRKSHPAPGAAREAIRVTREGATAGGPGHAHRTGAHAPFAAHALYRSPGTM